jgi:hypothetical protein
MRDVENQMPSDGDRPMPPDLNEAHDRSSGTAPSVPGGSVEPDNDYSFDGTDIRPMWDEGAGPLWSTGEGPLPDQPEWLRRVLGLSDDLIVDLLAWMRDMDTAARFHQVPDSLRANAVRLVERLRVEAGDRWKVWPYR